MNYQLEELIPIVADLAQRYTGCDSTSISYEKAQSFMGAVLYCLDEYAQCGSVQLVDQRISVKQQYQIGMELVQKKAEDVRHIFQNLSATFTDYGVWCLYDTVQKEIPKFLQWYDVRYCPQDTIVTLTYPILTDNHGLCGVDAVYQYICGIQLEQQFLQKFDTLYIQSVLKQYQTDYKYMAENICSVVLTNTIGHAIVGKRLEKQGFVPEEYEQITTVLKPYSLDALEQIIKNLIIDLLAQGYPEQLPLQEYLCQEAGNIAARIEIGIGHQQLDKLFVW